MFWSLAFQLLPEEVIIEDSAQKKRSGIKPAYSVYLTSRRVIFRFDGLGSSLTQSFFYHEILDVKPAKRFFVPYLDVKTEKRSFLLNTGDTDYWAKRILELKGSLASSAGQQKQASADSAGRTRAELSEMLTILSKHSLLSEEELKEKLCKLDSMNF